jgi:cytochrome c oxidase subunit III
MPATLVAQSPVSVSDSELTLSDNDRIGLGGGPGGPGHDLKNVSQIEPEPQGVPLSAYRLFTILAIIWIVTLFATLALVLESRWVHSQDWVSIPLPRILYVNTAFLLFSSLTIELARLSQRREESKGCTRWIFLTMVSGFVFVGGQIVAWQELSFRGLHLASNPGSFFFYLITGAHGVHFLVGFTLLAYFSIFVRRFSHQVKQRTILDALVLYWHFVDGLWLSLFALLWITLER